jgi:two-component sensor histidine kinase
MRSNLPLRLNHLCRMGNFVKSLMNIGVKPEDTVFDRRLKIAVNVLVVNAILSIGAVSILHLIFNNEMSNLSILIALPLFAIAGVLNARGQVMSAITYVFCMSNILLTIFSIRLGELSLTHVHFILLIIGIALLYQYRKSTFYFYFNLIFTLVCVVFVLLSFQFGWFSWFLDKSLNPDLSRHLNYIMLVVVSLVFTFTVVYTYYQQQASVLQSLQEQKILLAEVNHRVKNNMAVIIGLLNMKRNNTQNSETRQDMEDVKARVMSMALVHDRMYSDGNTSAIDMDGYVDDLVKEISHSFNLSNKVKFVISVEKLRVDVSVAIPLGLIINELITNAMKHAFLQTPEPIIFIEIVRKDGELLNVIIRDNGAGLQELKLGTDRMGMVLIEALTEQLGGTHSFSEENGLKFELTFSVSPVNQRRI